MRKSIQYKVENEGRDKGKVFLLTEMPASQAERWALRAFLALARNGVEISDKDKDAGLAGLAANGLTLIGKLPFDEAQALMEEMFTCVKMIPDPQRPSVTRELIEDDIEEISTRFNLRVEVFKLHVDFSEPADPSE